MDYVVSVRSTVEDVVAISKWLEGHGIHVGSGPSRALSKFIKLMVEMMNLPKPPIAEAARIWVDELRFPVEQLVKQHKG